MDKANSNISQNIRFLCCLEGSVAEAARKIGIHRQQLNKYLSGVHAPSISSLRKICDYFVVEESEVFLEVEQFKEIYSSRAKVDALPIGLCEKYSSIAQASRSNWNVLSELCGVYHCTKLIKSSDELLHQTIVKVFEKDHSICTVRLDFATQQQGPMVFSSVVRQHGVINLMNNRFYWMESFDEKGYGASLTTTTLYSTMHGKNPIFSGHSVLVGSDLTQPIMPAPTVLSRINDSELQIGAVKQCGLFQFDTPHVPRHIQSHFMNCA